MPTHTKWQPSNGTEGAIFQAEWCDDCLRDQGEECAIAIETLFYTVDDPAYPTEWTLDTEGQPMCTAFEAIPERWNHCGIDLLCTAEHCNCGCVGCQYRRTHDERRA